MNLAQLEHFTLACRTGRLREVAETCCVTQQAVSSSIAALERELGVQLLERGPSGVRPTREGRELAPLAQDVLADVSRLRGAASGLRGLSGSLVLAYASCTISAAGPHPNQADIDAFERGYPGIELQLYEAESDSCLGLAERGTADVALVAGRPDAARFASRFLYDAELVLCVAADHPFAARDGSLSYADLRDVPQLLPPDLNYSLRVTREACLRWGFEPTHLEVPSSAGDHVGLVAEGYGVAFMPEGYEVALSNDRVRLVHMCPEEALRIPLLLAWPRGRQLSSAACALADYLAALMACGVDASHR